MTIRRTARLKRGKPPKRSGRIARKRRSPAEFRRIYGSQSRVNFVASLPCLVTTCPAPKCECAHIESGGTGRKADADRIVPLCPTHHRDLHQYGPGHFATAHRITPQMLQYAARATEIAWRAHCGEYGE